MIRSLRLHFILQFPYSIWICIKDGSDARLYLALIYKVLASMNLEHCAQLPIGQ